MTDTKDNSSLPLLLSITGAVLVVAVGGWFFLEQDTPTPIAARTAPVTAAVIDTSTSTRDMSLESTEDALDDEPGTDIVAVPVEQSSAGVDAELRKARLAADADILVFPPEQSALHYYGLVLATAPENRVASAELDTILARVGQTVTRHLEAEEFDNAFEIAVQVAKMRPEHSLVIETQQALDTRTEDLVAEAIKHAQSGADDQATQVLATAESLPGRNPDYFTAIRESLNEIREVRVAAERSRAQRARMAASDAKAAWVGGVRDAISQGNLIAPAGASARDLLAEHNEWTAERDELTDELLSALIATAQVHIDTQLLTNAEELIYAAIDLSGEPDRFEKLLASLESAYIEAESKRIARMSDLVQVKSVKPRYPRRAEASKKSGWVNIYFTVTPEGETAEIEVVKSEPKDLFDRAAVAAVEKWEFQPFEYRGQIIDKRAAARLVFAIE